MFYYPFHVPFLIANQLNLQRTEELFNERQVTSVEFRQAQVNLTNHEMG